MADIIAIAELRRRRAVAAINADDVRWEIATDDLGNAMARSGLSDAALINATLGALLEVLQASLNLPDAKQQIAQRLDMFFVNEEGA